jgi:manganese transport protein
MPHAVFLHSGLTQYRVAARDDGERRMLVRFSNREVIMALAVAGMVNMAMVIMAAAAFHHGYSDVSEIETAYHTLTPLLGTAAATVFLVSLLTSGVSSSVVGTMAGQMIMQGFVRISIPIWLRRAITMIPAFAVVAIGVNPTKALVMSQVVLSIALPVPMLALLHFTSSRRQMGDFANRRITVIAASFGAFVVLTLNFVLLAGAFGVPVPFLG